MGLDEIGRYRVIGWGVRCGMTNLCSGGGHIYRHNGDGGVCGASEGSKPSCEDGLDRGYLVGGMVRSLNELDLIW